MIVTSSILERMLLTSPMLHRLFMTCHVFRSISCRNPIMNRAKTTCSRFQTLRTSTHTDYTSAARYLVCFVRPSYVSTTSRVTGSSGQCFCQNWTGPKFPVPIRDRPGPTIRNLLLSLPLSHVRVLPGQSLCIVSQ